MQIIGRHEDEAQRGRMWLRLNVQQTADLTPQEFGDPDLARDVDRAITNRRCNGDRTSVIYVTPTVGRVIPLWSERKGKTNTAHRRGAEAMRHRMFPQWWCQSKKALDLLSQLFCNAPLFRGKGWVRIGHYFENGQSNWECEIGTELGDTCEPLSNPLLLTTFPKPRVPLFQPSLLSAKSH